jgi:hypothetical protein
MCRGPQQKSIAVESGAGRTYALNVPNLLHAHTTRWGPRPNRRSASGRPGSQHDQGFIQAPSTQSCLTMMGPWHPSSEVQAPCKPNNIAVTDASANTPTTRKHRTCVVYQL